MATWVGEFQKRKGTPAGAKIGLAIVRWTEGEDVLFTFSKNVDIGSGADANAFRTEANAERDLELARQAESDTLTTQLTNYMNT